MRLLATGQDTICGKSHDRGGARPLILHDGSSAGTQQARMECQSGLKGNYGKAKRAKISSNFTTKCVCFILKGKDISLLSNYPDAFPLEELGTCSFCTSVNNSVKSCVDSGCSMSLFTLTNF